MTWAIVNSLLRILLTLFLSYKIVRFGSQLNLLERAGMGLMGSGSFLTVALIWDIRKAGTPFDGWATTLMTFGALIYFYGRMTRHWKQEANNKAQIKAPSQGRRP